jgi:hypothetical protein
MSHETGPHLTAALICERVLSEQDQVLSAIRIIDRVTFGVGADGKLVQPQQPIWFMIMLKSGSARGSYNVEIRREKPSGEQSPLLSAPVYFEGEDRGASLVVAAAFEPDQAGLYWFDVYFEEERITRIPLRVIYQPLPTIGGEG